MVRWTAAPLIVLVLAGGAQARRAPDWRRAGGDLFVQTAPPPESPSTVEAGDTTRLQPLAQPYDSAVAAAAARHGLDPKLLHALVTVESAYRAQAVSPVGAGGLTQLMPATATALGVRDRFDPAANLSGGAAYLAGLLLRFGDLRLALAAYNAGPGRVAELGRVPRIGETQAYVTAVVDCYLALSAGRTVRAAPDCRTPRGTP